MLLFLIRLLLSLLPWPPAAAPAPPIHILNTVTGRAIPYGSAGIRNKPIGTVADSLGRFTIAQLRGAAPTDTLVVSCVGYHSQKVVMAKVAEMREIKLMPQAQLLQEIVVHGRQPKRIVLGHNWVSAFTSYGFYTTLDTVAHARLGREVGTLLAVKHPTRLEVFHLFTSGRDFKSVTFRLNVYAFAQGQPQHSLLSKDVIFTVDGQRRGWTTVDLRPFAITLAGPQQVVATVQWLSSEVGRPGSRFLNIPVHLSAVHTTYSRSKSAQAWTTASANPSLYFDALSYPE